MMGGVRVRGISEEADKLSMLFGKLNGGVDESL